MKYDVVIPVMIAFAISAVLGPIVIPFLRRLKVGQTERKELESHGWFNDIGKYHHHFPLLYEGLS